MEESVTLTKKTSHHLPLAFRLVLANIDDRVPEISFPPTPRSGTTPKASLSSSTLCRVAGGRLLLYYCLLNYCTVLLSVVNENRKVLSVHKTPTKC